MTSLTREILLEKAKPRQVAVEVPEFGTVHLVSMTNVQQARREVQYAKDPEALEFSLIHQLIDQVRNADGTALFDETDADLLSSLDATSLAPLYMALQDFNIQKKAPSDESTATSGS